MLKILKSPITQFNLLLLGAFIVVQVIHTHAHYQMDMDVDSYCTKFVRKNKEFLNKFD